VEPKRAEKGAEAQSGEVDAGLGDVHVD